MQILIDRIRLHSPACRAAFIEWVREVDYAACRDLPSVLRFEVVEVVEVRGDAEGGEGAGGGDCDFFEIIHVSSWCDFERDMQSPLFHGLRARFEQLAAVVGQLAGEPIPPGYVRHA
ncbi:hypothetical protein BKK81_22685 [Cupriavidus sp. USMAHM13]|uniref:hypothetical protein n=1 Tax=Cupriavidus sp. USMAHM13 TaxID=1389192 RepID=UPI0008A6A920|nr:hypothetical protein [Cupriavidus sp. USMAHM13]AOZ02123.1 hypothetical protein BKK81_22685 [Cupriavidus sp. USMAHM13]